MHIRSSHWWLLTPLQAYISCPTFLLSSSLSSPPSLPPFLPPFLPPPVHPQQSSFSLSNKPGSFLSQGLCITFSLDLHIAHAPSHHSTFYSKVTTSKIHFQLDRCSIIFHSFLSYPGLFSFLVLQQPKSSFVHCLLSSLK